MYSDLTSAISIKGILSQSNWIGLLLDAKASPSDHEILGSNTIGAKLLIFLLGDPVKHATSRIPNNSRLITNRQQHYKNLPLHTNPVKCSQYSLSSVYHTCSRRASIMSAYHSSDVSNTPFLLRMECVAISSHLFRIK